MRSLTAIFFALSASLLFSQQIENLQKANIYFDKHEYVKASSLYHECLPQVNNNGKCTILERLIVCYQNLGEYDKEKAVYGQMIKNCLTSNIEIYNYAQALKKNGQYKRAKEVVTLYNKKEPSDSMGVALLASCDSAIQWMSDTSQYIVRSCQFNTEYDEICPAIIHNKLYYSSNIETTIIATISDYNDLPKFKLYEYDSIKNKSSKLPQFINYPNQDVLSCTYDSRRKELLFTRSTNLDNHMSLQLYSVKHPINNFNRSKSFIYRKKFYSTGHPCMNTHGDTLFFSGKENENDDNDIFLSIYEDGQWTAPKRLPGTINTDKDELFPFYQNGKLYFSSEGHFNIGGFDIFESVLKNGTWHEAQNMKPPYSSPADDMSFFYKKDTEVYISSNREESIGGFDVYFIRTQKDLH